MEGWKERVAERIERSSISLSRGQRIDSRRHFHGFRIPFPGKDGGGGGEDAGELWRLAWLSNHVLPRDSPPFPTYRCVTEFLEFLRTLSKNSSERIRVERSMADLAFLEVFLSLVGLLELDAGECAEVTKTEFCRGREEEAMMAEVVRKDPPPPPDMSPLLDGAPW